VSITVDGSVYKVHTRNIVVCALELFRKPQFKGMCKLLVVHVQQVVLPAASDDLGWRL
jgi:hypothetical protein